MNTGDYNLIKSLNRKIILEKMIANKCISRAQLSKDTGLNKATVSTQIAQLLKEDLVLEIRLDASSGGRKPILLSLNAAAGYVIGIELDRDHMHCILTDLKGDIQRRAYVAIDTSSFEHTKRTLKHKIYEMIAIMPHSQYELVGIGIGIHGIVDKDGKIAFAIHSNWKDVDLKNEMERTFKVPVWVDNNTNLCAYAEKTFSVDDKNLLCITASSGIGLGIIIDNVVFKGLNGFAGEVGHMIIREDGKKCSCGNSGCWELYASEKAFLEEIAVQKKVNQCSIQDVKAWIAAKDATTLKQLEIFSVDLSIGINNIINAFNPETIIVNSEIIALYPEVITQIKKALSSRMNDYRRIVCSNLGKDACILGACAIAITHFLKISDLKLI